jgi:integrase
MTPATAWYLWNTIRSDVSATGKANIDDVVLHAMRHTGLIRSGMRLHHVSKWAGHADVVITEKRYVKVDAGDLRDVRLCRSGVPVAA